MIDEPVGCFEQGASWLLHRSARNKAFERWLESVAALLRRLSRSRRDVRLCLDAFTKSTDVRISPLPEPAARTLGLRARPGIHAPPFIRLRGL